MITQEQFGTIEALYNYYNNALFDGELKDCMLNLSRKKGSMGFFAPNRWRSKQEEKIHEISINPDTFEIDDEEFHRTLVHEMCHLWQEDLGKPSRRNYHNKEWGNKMIEIGLMPSSTGKEGGKTTGQKMNDYTIPDGLFKRKFDTIVSKDKKLRLPYYPAQAQVKMIIVVEQGEKVPKEKVTKSGVKFKYTCRCKVNIWGKFNLRVLCPDCNGIFELQDQV